MIFPIGDDNGHRQADQAPSSRAAQGADTADDGTDYAAIAKAVYDSLAIDPDERTPAHQLISMMATCSVSPMFAYSYGIQNCYRYEPEPEPEIEDAGITVGEIVGWRAWLIDENGLLESVHTRTPWLPEHPVTGAPDTYAGVHAWRDLSSAYEYAKTSSIGLRVCGRVALWGTVIEHERGYRAEFAKVLSFDYLFGDFLSKRWRLRRLREAYGLAP